MSTHPLILSATYILRPSISKIQKNMTDRWYSIWGWSTRAIIPATSICIPSESRKSKKTQKRWHFEKSPTTSTWTAAAAAVDLFKRPANGRIFRGVRGAYKHDRCSRPTRDTEQTEAQRDAAVKKIGSSLTQMVLTHGHESLPYALFCRVKFPWILFTMTIKSCFVQKKGTVKLSSFSLQLSFLWNWICVRICKLSRQKIVYTGNFK